jgi:hypothetical protein
MDATVLSLQRTHLLLSLKHVHLNNRKLTSFNIPYNELLDQPFSLTITLFTHLLYSSNNVTSDIRQFSSTVKNFMEE